MDTIQFSTGWSAPGREVMTHKTLFSAVAVALTLIAFFPYIRSILRGKTKPHVFSWVIWGTTTIIVFLAQVESNGGVGAWPIGVSGCITIYIAYLAYLRKTDRAITKTDWIFLVAALSSLPFWYVTSDPLWAVVILTSVDIIGFGPTFRRAYMHPFEERLAFFGLFVVRNLLAIMALEQYSLTTVLFPAAVTSACLLLMLMVAYRRWSVAV